MAIEKIKINYSKHGTIRFVGHLDTMNIFFRALRRIDTPVTYTQGFNSHIKSSFSPALALGFSSDAEYIELFLESRVEHGRLKEDLQKELPEGIVIRDIQKIPVIGKSCNRKIRAVEYQVNLKGLVKDLPELNKRKEEFLAKKEFLDINTDKDLNCNIVLPVSKASHIDPRKIVRTMLNIKEDERIPVEFVRKKFYFAA